MDVTQRHRIFVHHGCVAQVNGHERALANRNFTVGESHVCIDIVIRQELDAAFLARKVVCRAGHRFKNIGHCGSAQFIADRFIGSSAFASKFHPLQKETEAVKSCRGVVFCSHEFHEQAGVCQLILNIYDPGGACVVL